LQCDPVLLRVDVEQRLPALHVVVVPDVDRQHLARHLGGHRHDEGLHPRLRGVRGQPVGGKIPEQAAGDQRQHDRGADPRRLARLRRSAPAAVDGSWLGDSWVIVLPSLV
jgi:hypothetical protein